MKSPGTHQFFGLAVGQCAIVLAASKDVVPDPVDAIVAGGRLLGFFTKRGRLMGISWGYPLVMSK
jgi:predicted GNAT superfamily acetyltransferase